MLSPRTVAVGVLVALAALAGCSQSDPSTVTAPSAAASVVPASPAAGSGSDYNQALQEQACYEDSFDAASDPLDKAVSCDDAKAAFRLVGIQAGSAADCPPNQVLVSEQQQTPDGVAPSLCLEAVTH